MPPDFTALRRLADESATKRIQPFIDQVQDERGYQNARRDVSNQAATNFTQAISGLFTGGRGIDDPEGQKHSLENFGGSYLGGMAAMLGTQLMAQIGHSFTDQDHELAQRLSVLMDKHPEEADAIYSDLVSAEREREQSDRSIIDADYKSQIAALAALVKFERENRPGPGRTPTVKTDPSTGALIQYDPATGKWVQVTGGKPAGPMSASQIRTALDGANQIVTQAVKQGGEAVRAAAVKQARLWLRDNGFENYGTWKPYSVPGATGGKKGSAPKTYKFADGSVWKVKPDGSGMTRIKAPGNTSGGKGRPAAVQARVRAEIEANVPSWAEPLQATTEDRFRAAQLLKDKGARLPAEAFTARYVAHPRYFRDGRWQTVLPGGFTNDPSKAKLSAGFDSVFTQAIDVAGELYDLGWSEGRVRSWVSRVLGRLGIKA